MAKLKVILSLSVEHISMPPLKGKRVNSYKKSSVKDNFFCHVYSFDDFKIFNNESRKFKRLIKKSLLVNMDNYC